MKKGQKGMNTRAIKRKLGLQPKQINEMILNVNQLIEKDIFSSVNPDKRYVTIDKKQLVNALKGQVGELEKELKNLQPNKKVEKETGDLINGIKINIS